MALENNVSPFASTTEKFFNSIYYSPVRKSCHNMQLITNASVIERNPIEQQTRAFDAYKNNIRNHTSSYVPDFSLPLDRKRKHVEFQLTSYRQFRWTIAVRLPHCIIIRGTFREFYEYFEIEKSGTAAFSEKKKETKKISPPFTRMQQ